ncbi:MULTISPECIES: hypothetical protein [unclassified Nostoc]|uniref:hypothetical protein n=1 Tax=unclassified Nostoc TaxID=2593658 RepID=UPI0021AB50DE|nr:MULTISPECIES: hypothetical protein [unclassified Nostoc]
MQLNITTLFMLGYANAAPNLQNYGSQGRRGLITGDMTKFLAVLKQGLNSQEHAKFVSV